jgi:hypothetical protein
MFLLWVKEAEKEIEIPPRVYRPGDLICMDYFGIFSPREFGVLVLLSIALGGISISCLPCSLIESLKRIGK